jgi:hypothetical protein
LPGAMECQPRPAWSAQLTIAFEVSSVPPAFERVKDSLVWAVV